MTFTNSLIRFLLLASLVAMSAYSYPIRGSQRAEQKRRRRLQKMGMDEKTSAPSTFVSDFPSGAPALTLSEVPTLNLIDALVADTAIPTSEPTNEPKSTKGDKPKEDLAAFARPEDYDAAGEP
jgi:hypothetical protein